MTVLDALARALRDLFNLRVLWVVVWPMLLAVLLWLVLGVTFWGPFSGWIEQGLDAFREEFGLQTATSSVADEMAIHYWLLIPMFAGSVAAMVPGAFMVSRLGREKATIGITLLSISLALPTLIWG